MLFKTFRFLTASLIFGSGSALSFGNETEGSTNAEILNVVKHLQPILSREATIYFPGSEGYVNATKRGDWGGPTFSIAVAVATESDVQKTVQIANLLGVPFLAVGGSHGSISSLEKLKNGVEIWLRRLNTVEIAADGSSAIMGGGTLSGEATTALWAAGKQSVSGACDCTSVLGPGLGGGYGILQGRYGLVTDTLLELNVVLANGSAVTASEHSHPDLFWAMKGAGHNFGIVTSFRKAVFDVPVDDVWSVFRFVFTSDKLERVFEITNTNSNVDEEGGQPPVQLLSWISYERMVDVDSVKPVVHYYLLWQGEPSEAEPYTAPLNALGPAVSSVQTVSYPELTIVTGRGLQDPVCEVRGSSRQRFPINTLKYNITAQRRVFDVYHEYTSKYPALNTSVLLNEGYPLQGVKAVPADSTAFPHRAKNLLLSVNNPSNIIGLYFAQRVSLRAD